MCPVLSIQLLGMPSCFAQNEKSPGFGLNPSSYPRYHIQFSYNSIALLFYNSHCTYLELSNYLSNCQISLILREFQ